MLLGWLDCLNLMIGEKSVENMVNIAIDKEWVNLVENAKKIGLTIEEVREFLRREGQKA